MEVIETRQATAGDIGGLTASSAALFAQDGVARDNLRNAEWPEAHGAQWCTELIDDPSALVLVAVADESVVGHLIASFAPASSMWIAPRAEIVSVFVEAPWRGKAVGGRLVSAFVDWAKERGAVRLTVSAYASNTDAVGFYRRYGFEPLSLHLAVDL